MLKVYSLVKPNVAVHSVDVKAMVGWTLHIVHGMLEAKAAQNWRLELRRIVGKHPKINMLELSGICAVIAAPDARAMRWQLGKALRLARTVELRLDWLSDDRQISSFLGYLATRRPRATLIATCRRRAAGGRYRGTITRQLAHLAEAIQAGCEWYDLEIETLRTRPPELVGGPLDRARRLTSAHFFKKPPASLSEVASELANSSRDAIKIAVQCDSLADSRKLLRFAGKRRNIVVVPMGDVALPTRFLALRVGNKFAYAPVENSTAPGQIPLDEMKRIYRGDQFDARTRVYGVIGDPIAHSLSPAMHNAGFAARRVNAVYLPFLTRDLRDFVDSVEPLGIKGFSVTLPHKEDILRFLHRCDPLAEKIGAVNTVVVRSDGKLHGYNTDYVGVLQTLERRIKLRGGRALIVGAGGAARAVAFALTQAGVAVFVSSRRFQRAKHLAQAVGGEPLERAMLRQMTFDAIVNATPVGMHPSVAGSPLKASELNSRLVFDIVYRPQTTRLLQMAARRGIQTVSGVEMFVAQGAAQWTIWTGEQAPVAAMRRAVLCMFSMADNSRRFSHSRGRRPSK